MKGRKEENRRMQLEKGKHRSCSHAMVLMLLSHRSWENSLSFVKVSLKGEMPLIVEIGAWQWGFFSVLEFQTGEEGVFGIEGHQLGFFFLIILDLLQLEHRFACFLVLLSRSYTPQPDLGLLKQ